MKIKSFIAPTIQEALLNVKNEMGESSLILETRNIDEGDLKGSLGQKLVEIVAAENINDKNAIKEQKSVNPLSTFTEPFYDIERNLPDTIKGLYLNLLAQQVEKEHAQIIVRETLYKLRENVLRKKESQRQVLRERLISKIKTADSNLTKEPSRKIMALTGSTGVGKTSTIAKLATIIKRTSDKDIILINIKESFPERLASCAKIVGAKVATVTTPQELKTIIEKFGNSSHIFIDTPGISCFDNIKLLELNEYLENIPNLETHLVINATTRFIDNINIIKNFSVMPTHRLLFTKADETDIYGGILSIVMETQIPISYIGKGQEIPESIVPATTNVITKMILG